MKTSNPLGRLLLVLSTHTNTTSLRVDETGKRIFYIKRNTCHKGLSAPGMSTYGTGELIASRPVAQVVPAHRNWTEVPIFCIVAFPYLLLTQILIGTSTLFDIP